MVTVAQLRERIGCRDARVAIIGLGYVGLPLAVVFAEAGFHVVGVDVDPRKIEAISRGTSYIEDIPSARLAALVNEGRLTATSDFAALRECDAVSICVPTPLRKTGDPDISYIIAATEQIALHLHASMLVVLESTTYPGTTTEIILPRLSAHESGLRVGEDFFLCFSPERVDPGRTDWTTVNTPKVMGGVTPQCLQAGLALYGAAIQTVVPVSSTEAAEMTKLLENTFRAVNIGMVNEVLLMCERLDLDAWEVIEAAATKPFGFMKFTPGPGLGGHCIPIDPLYLSWKMRTLNYRAQFIELASEINTSMPRHWARKVQDALNDAGKSLKGSHVLVLGVAYKKDVSDLRESPSLDIIHLLQAKGAVVSYHDPHVPSFHYEGLTLQSDADLDAALERADCVVVATDHSAYDWAAIDRQARLVVDTRRAIKADANEPPL
ncbi:MAG: nucleotide sugar dehydrogenase [Chloroflexales bacterium]